MTPEQAGAILAALSISVHKTPPPPGVISLPDLICALVQSPGNLLPKHLARGVLALLESLPPGDGLCHGDVHPGNVIMTAEGPEKLIDWTWTRRAGPALDLGHCHVVLCELIPENHDDPARPRALDGPRAGHPPLMRPRLTRSPVPSECRRSSTCSWRRAPTVAPADACDLGVLGEPRRAAFAAAKPAGAFSMRRPRPIASRWRHKHATLVVVEHSGAGAGEARVGAGRDVGAVL